MGTRSEPIDSRVPATIVTGYLGAGKTSLINALINSGSAGKLAVIVNEFGDIGIDGELIATGSEELIELSSGCVCCVVRGDLIRTMRKLLAQQSDLDGIIIETTGLANPGPVIQTFMADQVIAAQCRLDAVVVVADAVHLAGQLETSADCADQIAFGDIVILNKMDAATASMASIEHRIAHLNPFAEISGTNFGAVSPALVLGRRLFDIDRVLDRLPEEPIDDDGHSHLHGMSSVSLTLRAPLDADRFETWLRGLLERNGADILRTKGVLLIAGDPRKFVIQSVHMMVEGAYAGAFNEDEKSSRFVLIGRNLQPDVLHAGFAACRAEHPFHEEIQCQS